ncbi:unnamed protein product [Ostreobium quekettii]|uniref:Uncharacterized protein n=1 Tax=Ostreobium quekettii TaxID=121088 RepID=A0A8S1J234_9CHLO|nr:unnamed protein product [Ostreobium quekettii]
MTDPYSEEMGHAAEAGGRSEADGGLGGGGAQGLAVPMVDMSTDEEVAAAVVRQACTTLGFFKVANHGVPQALVDAFFEHCHRLFALPIAEKMAMLQDVNNRGYTPMAEETLDPGAQSAPDTKEGFYFGREVALGSEEASKPLHGPNQWPDEASVPGFRDGATQYYEALRGLAMRLLRLFARALNLAPEFFDDKFTRPIVSLRPLHYSAQVSQPEAGTFGAGAHTDYGMLTILATDDTPGLQIHVGGQWIDVPPQHGTFIINIGDLLER